MKIISEKQTGKRMVMGTDHPIITQLQRHEKYGKLTWTVAGICNGICEWSEDFETLRAARIEFEK